MQDLTLRAFYVLSLLLVLMIASRHAEALALWALHLHVWDLLVKPVSSAELSQCIAALVDLERGGASPGGGAGRPLNCRPA